MTGVAIVLGVSGTPLVTLPATVREILAWLPHPLTPDGLLLYGAGGMLLLVGLGKLINWYRDRRTEDIEMADVLDEDLIEEGVAEQQVLDDVAEQHQAVVAPDAIEWETRAARVGDQWTSTIYIADYPDYPKDGYLSELFNRTDVEFDLTVRIRPRNQSHARSELKETADDLHVDAELDQSVRGIYLKERAQEATATYKAVENGTRVFSQAAFVTVRADDRESLREARSKLLRDLREAPANLIPKTAVCRQDHALQAAAPVGPNPFGSAASSIALGDAVGALLASAQNPTILEPRGVEVGLHKDTKSPIVVDPFNRDSYAMLTIGDPGAGKSFGAKQRFIRSIEQSANRLGIIIEPKRNWMGVAEALGARRIPVAGDVGLNPLEIKPTPDHVLQRLNEDENPLTERKDSALGFLRNFFAMRGIELGDRLATLEFGIETVYKRAGITTDPATHDRESPTLRDLRELFSEIAENPEAFVDDPDAEDSVGAQRRESDGSVVYVPDDDPATASDSESTTPAVTDEADTPPESDIGDAADTTKLQDDAEWLYHQLRPFDEDGRFENLGRPTAFDIRDERLIYLDFGHRTGQVSTRTILVMQLLISLMYERVKETPHETVMVIDESRYLLKHAENLQFLETVFRHHRHHDLSIRLLTQTIDEFFQHDEAKIILDQCAIKQFHRLEAMDDQWANYFDLNPAQAEFVRSAVPGESEADFSQALLGIDGEWRGIEVRAMDNETQVIDFDPRQQSAATLPGGDPRSDGDSASSAVNADRDGWDEVTDAPDRKPEQTAEDSSSSLAGADAPATPDADDRSKANLPPEPDGGRNRPPSKEDPNDP